MYCTNLINIFFSNFFKKTISVNDIGILIKMVQ